MSRDLGYIKWTDPDAWMEKMSGPRWNKIVADENARAKKILNVDPAILTRVKFYQNQKRPTYSIGKIKLTHSSGFLYSFFLGKQHLCFDIDTAGQAGYIYCYDIGSGAEHVRLQAIDSTGKLLWHKDGISEQCAVIPSSQRVYYIRAQKKLWFYKLCSCNLDGSDEKVHYTEKDGQYNLKLFKSPGRKLFLIRDNCGTMEGAPINGNPLSFKKIDNEWELLGFRGIESANPSEDYIITRDFGERTLWKNKVLVFKIIGHIWFDPWQLWTGAKADIYIDAPNMKFQKSLGRPNYNASLKRLWTTSHDGTKVPYILVKRSHTPLGLLVTGYGAYGLPTGLHDLDLRWGALLDLGWAIAIALIRGGGDHDTSWFKQGQHNGRIKGFEDFDAIIVSAQKETGLGAEKTVIYGRSAGGFLVAAALNRNGDKLFRGVYTEVPYVDVLRTTTNDKLPLTVLEYDEFGNPAKYMEDFLTNLKLSPCDNIPPGGCPNVAVLCRSALNDSEVYAYEPVKWITRLRKAETKRNMEKILVLKDGQGHFAPEESMATDIAEDFTFFTNRVRN